MTNLLEDYKADFFTFVEAGFIAVNQFDEDAAVKIFKTAELLDPTSSLPQLGAGYTHLCKLELKPATDIFEKIVEKEPNNGMAKALLGLALSFNPAHSAKGEKTLEEAAKSDDPSIKSLAANALHFVQKFVKKQPNPAGK